ncbi:MAG: hypothetical protein RR809_09015, partial [Lachnospiraceae bacterium]
MRNYLYRVGALFLAVFMIVTSVDFGSIVMASDEKIDIASKTTYSDDNTTATVELTLAYDQTKFELIELKDPSGVAMDITNLTWSTTENKDYSFTYRYKEIVAAVDEKKEAEVAGEQKNQATEEKTGEYKVSVDGIKNVDVALQEPTLLTGSPQVVEAK